MTATILSGIFGFLNATYFPTASADEPIHQVYVLDEDITNIPGTLHYDESIPLASVGSIFLSNSQPITRALVVSSAFLNQVHPPAPGVPGSSEYVALYTVLGYEHMLFALDSKAVEIQGALGFLDTPPPWDPALGIIPRVEVTNTSSILLGEGLWFRDGLLNPVDDGWSNLRLGLKGAIHEFIGLPKAGTYGYQVGASVPDYNSVRDSIVRHLADDGGLSCAANELTMSSASWTEEENLSANYVIDPSSLDPNNPADQEVLASLVDNRFLPMCCPSGRSRKKTRLIGSVEPNDCIPQVDTGWVLCQTIFNSGTMSEELPYKTCWYTIDDGNGDWHFVKETNPVHDCNLSWEHGDPYELPSWNRPLSNDFLGWVSNRVRWEPVIGCLEDAKPNLVPDVNGEQDLGTVSVGIRTLYATFPVRIPGEMTASSLLFLGCALPNANVFVRWHYDFTGNILDISGFHQYVSPEYICSYGWQVGPFGDFPPGDVDDPRADVGFIWSDVQGAKSNTYRHAAAFSSETATLRVHELHNEIMKGTIDGHNTAEHDLSSRDFSQCPNRETTYSSTIPSRFLPCGPPSIPVPCVNCPPTDGHGPCIFCPTPTPTSTATPTSTSTSTPGPPCMNCPTVTPGSSPTACIEC